MWKSRPSPTNQKDIGANRKLDRLELEIWADQLPVIWGALCGYIPYLPIYLLILESDFFPPFHQTSQRPMSQVVSPPNSPESPTGQNLPW
jgi:hypothetical protein